MKSFRIHKWLLAVTIIATLVFPLSITFAQGKGKGNGNGGGGGGGGGSSLDYQIVQLDDLDGTLTSSLGYDLNDQQEVVGITESTDPNLAGQNFAVYWSVIDGSQDVQTTAHLLPANGLSDTVAKAINNQSQIVGRGDAGSGDVGLYWPTPDDQPLVLSPLSGDNVSEANKINGDGIICGWSWFVTENPDGSLSWTGTPVVWQAGIEIFNGVPNPVVSGAVPLPMPDDHGIRVVDGINDLDASGICQIVGSTQSPTLENVPVRWSVTSTVSGLVVNPNVELLDMEGRANGINNLGEVCGVSKTDGVWDGTVWSGINKYTLNRARFIGITRAFDINDSGLVVGEGPYEKRGVFYYFTAGVWETPQSDMILLDRFLNNNSPLLNLTSANAVNTAGDIAGGGWTGEYKAYLAIRR